MQVTLDVEAVRARFSALRRPYAFFDGPAGTQVPDEVIDAIAGYLRDSNANVGGQFETSRRIGEPRGVRARDRRPLPRLHGGRGDLRAEHDQPQLHAHANRRTRVAGGRRDRHDATRPRRQRRALARAAHDLRLVVRFADYDLSDLAEQLSTGLVSSPSPGRRTRSAPWSTRRGSATSPTRYALAWVDAVHYVPHGPIDVAEIGADVFPLLAAASSTARTCTRVRPAETAGSLAPLQGASRARLRDRDGAARAARRVRRSGRVPRVGRAGGDRGPRTVPSASASLPVFRRA